MLKIDIDGKAVDWERIRAVSGIFKLKFNFDRSRWAKTKHGYHIYLCPREYLSGQTEVFLQSLMGSDFKRECLNWLRIMRGSAWQRKNFNVLFVKKYYVALDGRTVLASSEHPLDKGILIKRLKDWVS